MTAPVRFEVEAADGPARAGMAHAARNSYRTPCFMPVGTRGAVRHLSAADLEDLGAQIVLGNTYHLMLRPGAATIADLGGLGRFTGWDGLTLTDSGGFQVFSLAHGNVADEIKGRRGGSGSSGGVVEISERGVAFRSYLDGADAPGRAAQASARHRRAR